jgi:hypothetical protein
MVFHGLIVECSGLKALSSEGVFAGLKPSHLRTTATAKFRDPVRLSLRAGFFTAAAKAPPSVEKTFVGGDVECETETRRCKDKSRSPSGMTNKRSEGNNKNGGEDDGDGDGTDGAGRVCSLLLVYAAG